MGSLSVWHWLIFLAVALLFFGGSGKISAVMGDFAKGIKSFKKGLQDDAEEARKPADVPRTIESSTTKPHDTHATGTGSKVG
ncbi:MAG: twin-arginine translocase TatA/TatE family subunit [Hyphomicrobiaceae bacterium]